jgi:tRNA A-37 threonylcarbamoyl transferase component Bud32/membrane protein YdbS with pleckstrin-like domain
MPAFDFVLGGRYRLLAPLGEGGMARVYRARDLRLNREVAVKILHDDLTRDPGFLSRFEREAQVVAGLAHPNIVPVYDVGGEDGAPYIIMEYIRGRTLKETLDAGGPLSEERAVAMMLPILDALGYAHRQGLIHRDVKPHNILLTTDGTPRLADFGIAHLVDTSTTRTAAILGSAQYLSPEQSRGEEATERSDIYACGIVLYEMLAGRPPFEGANALAVANQHLNTPPPPLSATAGPLTPELERTIGRALEKVPSARFADTSEMQAALQRPRTEWDPDATAIQSLEGTALRPLDATSIQPVQAVGAAIGEASGAPTVVGRRPDMILRRSARKTLVLAVLLAALVVVLGYAAQLTVSGYSLPSYPSTPYALLPAGCAVALVLSWFDTRSWRYTMDGDAAVVQWGLFSHHRFGVPIRHITTLELKQSPIDRVMGVGTVELCARDQHGRERRVVMEDLPHPRQTYEDLMRHLGRAARERG